MITYRQLATAFNRLGIDRTKPIIANSSLAQLGHLAGGTETVLGAILSVSGGLMMPTFTYKTMVTPDVGPPENGLVYGSNGDMNLMAQFFTPDMPADPMMGRAAEVLRQNPRSMRSTHPILSFAGIGVDEAIMAQTLQEPLAPIRILTEAGGYVLLIGVDHTANTSLHYAEKLAGRKQFIRWALTAQGVVECPGWPGSSEGFRDIQPHLEKITTRVVVGNAHIQALPLPEMIAIAEQVIRDDPLAFLPDDSEDMRVQDARKAALS